MLFAISVAFDELSNSGDWTNYLTPKELEQFYKGRDKYKNLIK